jgi:hypothetical protein
VYLSDQFTAATDPARRTDLAAAAETLIAQNRTPCGRGPADRRRSADRLHRHAQGRLPQAVAYLGIATGALGEASEALRVLIEGDTPAIYGVLMLMWTGAVGGESVSLKWPHRLDELSRLEAQPTW